MGIVTWMSFEVELTDAAIRDGVIDFGEIELPHSTPMSGESNRQQVQMAFAVSRFGDDEMLDLGSLVALTADRYSWFGQAGLREGTIHVAAGRLDELVWRFANLPARILDNHAGQGLRSTVGRYGRRRRGVRVGRPRLLSLVRDDRTNRPVVSFQERDESRGRLVDELLRLRERDHVTEPEPAAPDLPSAR